MMSGGRNWESADEHSRKRDGASVPTPDHPSR